MPDASTLSFLLAVVGALSTGLVGGFALMKRMTLAGDVISHVALPGIGLALLFHLDPVLGGAATLLVGTILIWHLEKRADLSTETAIGVIFAASLAVGALVTPNEELIEALFGSSASSDSAFALALPFAIALAVIALVWSLRHKLVLALFSPDLARTTGVNVNLLNLVYLLTFSASILVGLRLLGALLVGALIIVPAAVARQLTHTLNNFLIVSSLASALSVAAGWLIAARFGLPIGPVATAAATALFVVSLVKKKD